MPIIENFEVEIKELGRKRRVWVYLPYGYCEDGDPLPVIYMHDGQNLFYDDHAGYGVAWHVDKAIDDIYYHKGVSAAVVGVECLPERRLSEYSPWKAVPNVLHDITPENCGGEGDEYAQFFADSLVDIVEKKYNFARQRNGRAVAGSSMGGLISCYIGLKYQSVFETMGLFSTFTPFNQVELNNFCSRCEQQSQQHAYIYCGGKEGLDVPDSQMVMCSVELYNILAGQRNIQTKLIVDSEMKHFETAWDKYFYKFAEDFILRYIAQGE